MNKIVSWINRNIIALLAGFLLVFIPLYPKWPLFDILYGYNVRVRLEDFFVAFTLLIYLVQLVRKKVELDLNPVTIGLIVYLVIGFISSLVAVFVIQTVPLQYLHVFKTFLHWGRRIEYFTLFFIFFASIKSLRQIKIYITLFFATLSLIIIYGYGQKYLYWPAFSTMNREFAKGWWLYLTEHARVLSTFGGHYDLAGYLVIALSLGWSFFFGARNKLVKFAIGILIAGGFWLLILTASRTSFIAYLLGLCVVVFLWTFKKGLGWGISRLLVTTFLSILLMLSFGDLSDRFLHVLRISERASGLRAVLLKPTVSPPRSNAIFLENNLAAVTSRSDQPPTPYTSKPNQPATPYNVKPADVTGTEAPLYVPVKTATGTALVQKERTYSQNALMFDLSTGIRLDATWPRAIRGFLTDPILGSGYATLTKTSKYEFTEAESTDNDYLRALGETGLLGFAAFFGTILAMAAVAFRSLGGIRDSYLYSLTAGFIGVVFGLLLNAFLLDIFEASKVAYVFWGVGGITLGSLYLYRQKIKDDMKPLRIEFSLSESISRVKKIITSDWLLVSIILVLAFWVRTYRLDNPVADWHSWRQADTSAVTRNFIRHEQINWLYPTYDDISSLQSGKPNPVGYRFVEFPIYNAVTVYVKKLVPELTIESAGRVTTILATLLAVSFVFLLCRKLFGRRIAYLSALVYSFAPYSIYYGRTILPDPTMVAFSLGSLWAGVNFVENARWRFLVLSALLAVLALLVKPFAVFLLLPLGYFWLVGFGLNPRKIMILGVIAFLAVVPFLLWRFWMSHFPEGIPGSSWLYNSDGIRFKGAFWYWLFADRIGKLILGYWGLIPFGFGLVRRLSGKYSFFPILFLASSLLYLFVFATGNVRHDYYQILLIPSLSIIVGLGLDTLLFSKSPTTNRPIMMFLGVISSIFALAFGWYFVKDYFNINHPEIVAAGKEVEKLSADYNQALVIAPYDGDTAFLYQTNRRGWPIVEGTVDSLIQKGADYYVSVRFDDLTKKLIKNSTSTGHGDPPSDKDYRYKLLSLTDKYVIIQLVPDKRLPKN